jgi:pilus assembly protein FimV
LGKAAPGEPKEVLKLSKGEAPGGTGGKAPQARIHSLEEEVAARDKTIKEANERIAKLEKTIKDMQGLIDLKTKGMAQLQTPPGAPQATPGKPGATKPELPPAPPPGVAPAPPAPPTKPAPPPMASTTTPSVTPPPPAPGLPPKPPGAMPGETPPAAGPMAASGTQPGMPGTEGKPRPKPKPKIVTAPPPPAPSSMLDQLLDEPLYLAGGVAVLAVLGFLGYRFFRGRGDSGPRDDFAAEKKTSEVSAFAATGTDNTGAMAAAARAAAPAQVTEEVDPLAEAEIYLAYGRDGQAEEILKEALAAHPNRPEIHLKLLEIYAKRKDAQSFEPIFRELQGSTGSQGELWQQAVRLGYQLDPANSRYQAGKPSGAEAAAAEATATDKTLDFQVDAFDPAPEIGTLTDIDAGFGRRFATATGSTASAGDRLDLNIDLDDSAQTPGTKTDIDLGRLGASTDSTAVDVDLDSLGGSTRAITNTDIDLGTLSAEQSSQLPAMDFNLELPPADEKTESQLAQVDSLNFDMKFDDTASAAKEADGGLDFDIGKVSLEPEAAGKPEPMLDLDKSVPPMPEIDLSSISLDLGAAPAGTSTGTGSGKDERWYDVQTKFDLAKAYQEMGDKEGAREILQEVIAEGDAEQKAAAQKVLEGLA